MKIKFLGTGGAIGVPIWNCDCEICNSADSKNKRANAALLVTLDDGTDILVDFGPDIKHQLLKNSVRKIDYALLTHTHDDHCFGMAQLSRQDGIKIMMPGTVLEKFLGSYCDINWLTKRNPTASVSDFTATEIGGVKISAIILGHDKDYDEQGGATPCCGYIFESKKFRFAYLSDYNKIIGDDSGLYNLDLFISDANAWDCEKGHAGVKGSIESYKKYGPKQMLLTHMNHSMEYHDVLEKVSKIGNIAPAYDGLEIKI
ncbi:MAG: MBL fold metallo-hydrolase [Alphaproteobacteria bacterium]|nr:MBL fold metallo-hydrolase [Alphaproteobacteria bacterium]